MKRLLRTIVFLLLATFAAGTVAHAAATTEMSLRMVDIASPAHEMDDCDDCDKTSGPLTPCDQTCVQSFVALPVSEAVEIVVAPVSPGPAIPLPIAGRAGPPEQHPPR